VGSKLGAMQEGWKTLTNGKYYFMPSTYKAKAGGWLTDKGYKYYFGNNAVMKVGWLKVNDSKYYLEPKDGASQGRMYTGMHKISGATYYFDTTSGKMKTGWVKDGSDKYYFASNGKMKKGWLSLHGSKYYLNKSNGKMYTGRKKVSGSYYYFDTSSGKMLKNSAKKFNGKLHYFFASGKEVTGKGWFKGSDGKSRYAIGGGAVATGMWTISHIKYKFDSKTGVCVKSYGDKYDQKIQSYSSNTGKLIYVIKGKHQVRVYKGSKGNWSKIYTFTCSLGASSTPTYSGTYTVRGKTAHHNYTKSGQPAHWNNGVDLTGSGAKGVGFNGYVWSGKYPDGHIIDSKLGSNCTGGRVRVSESNSTWLFNNIGVGTKVLIQ
jgi:glucan-binding YG repeat protein